MPPPAIAPIVSWPSAPMFQTLARNPADSPTAIMISGAAFSASSARLPKESSGETKNANSVLSGAWPIAPNTAALTSTVAATAMTGVSQGRKREGLRRGSILNRIGKLPGRRGRGGGRAMHPAHEQSQLIGRHLGRRTRLRDHADIDDGEPVRQGHQLIEILRNHQHRR